MACRCHRTKLSTKALPGTRTAVNLAGLEAETLHRGPGGDDAGLAAAVRSPSTCVCGARFAGAAAQAQPRVIFHSGSSRGARRGCACWRPTTFEPGEEGWAQIRLSSPLALVKGDRFIIRDANDTLAGGTVVATQAARRPRRRPGVIAALEQLSTGDPAERVYASLAGAGIVLVATLTKAHGSDTAELLERLTGEGRAVRLGDAVVASADYERLKQTALQVIHDQQASHPLARGVAKEELRSRLGLQARPFTLLLEALTRDGFEDRGQLVATAGWAPALSVAQRGIADAYVASLKVTPQTPPIEGKPDAGVLAFLVDSGEVVDAGDGVVFEANAYREMVDEVVGLLRERETVTMAEVRDLLGSSRRYVQALLEHMDSQRMTTRRGDVRVLRQG